jgi:hypothetical protein
VKAHYSDKKLLSQIFFGTTCFLTSNKLILKGFLANDTWNNLQNPKNKIVEKKFTLKLMLND